MTLLIVVNVRAVHRAHNVSHFHVLFYKLATNRTLDVDKTQMPHDTNVLKPLADKPFKMLEPAIRTLTHR